MAVVAGRQAQLSFQAAVSQGVNGLLVSDEDSEANGSIQFQILQFAKLPSTLRHKPGIKSSSLPPSLSPRLETLTGLGFCGSSLLLLCVKSLMCFKGRDYPSVQGSFFGRSCLLIGHGGAFQFLTWSAISMFIGVCCG